LELFSLEEKVAQVAGRPFRFWAALLGKLFTIQIKARRKTS
jgi:hypothetical protein